MQTHRPSPGAVDFGVHFRRQVPYSVDFGWY